MRGGRQVHEAGEPTADHPVIGGPGGYQVMGGGGAGEAGEPTADHPVKMKGLALTPDGAGRGVH